MPDKEKIAIEVEVIEKTEQQFKKIQDQFKSLNKTLRDFATQSNRILKSQEKAFKEFSSSIENFKKEVKDLGRTTETSGEQTKKLHYHWRGLVWTIVRAEIVFRGIMRIIGFLKDSFATLVKTTDDYVNSMIRLSALHTTILQPFVRTREELKAVFDEIYNSSNQLFEVLEQLAIKTPLTAEQLMKVYQAFMSTGVAIDLTNKKHRELLVGMGIAIQQLTGGYGLSRQLYQEVRALITGVGKAYGEVIKYLRTLDPLIDEHIQQWRREGTLLEHLHDLLLSFVVAGDRVMNTVQGLGTSLETELKRIAREAFAPAYNSLIQFLKILVSDKGFASTFRDIIANIAEFSKVLIGLGVIAVRVGEIIYRAGVLAKKGWVILTSPFPPQWIMRILLFRKNPKQVIEKQLEDFKAFGRAIADLKKLPEELERIMNPPKIQPTRSSLGDFFIRWTSLGNQLATSFVSLNSQLEEFVTSVRRRLGYDTLDKFISFKKQLIDIINTSVREIDTRTTMLTELSQKSEKAKDFINFLNEFSKSTEQVLKTGNIAKLQELKKQWQDIIDTISKKDLPKDIRIILTSYASFVEKTIEQNIRLLSNFSKVKSGLVDIFSPRIQKVVSNFTQQFRDLTRAFAEFDLPKFGLDKQIQNVEQRYQSLLNNFIDYRERISVEINKLNNVLASTQMPENLKRMVELSKEQLEFLLRTIDSYIETLPQRKDKIIQFYREVGEATLELKQIGLEQAELWRLKDQPVQQLEQQIELLARQKQVLQELLTLYPKYSEQWFNIKQQMISTERQISDAVGRLKEQTGTFEEGFVEGMRRFVSETQSSFLLAKDLAYSTARAMERAFSNFFFDVMTGRLKSLQDYLRSFVNMVFSIISEMVARMMVAKMLVAVGFPIAGVAQGATAGVKGFQHGGIVTRPTLSILGEGGNPEAVVPLKHGKIPVELNTEKAEQKPMQLNITNVVDPNLLGDFLSSPQGENIVLNIIARNNYKVKKLLER